MSTYTAAKSIRQWRHPASRSESHIKDKREGEARRLVSWVPVATPESPSPKRDFAALKLEGYEFIREGDQWRKCADKEEFADYLVAEARARSWYISQTKRNGYMVEMKRRVTAPIKVLTTTFSPWLSEWTYQNLSLGEKVLEKLKLIRDRWLTVALGVLKDFAYVLGYSFHADTSNPHFDICISRQDGRGGRIGPPGLRLIGPWMIGVSRQIRADAKIAPQKEALFRRNIESFLNRYDKGDGAFALDSRLSRTLDLASAEVLGGELEVYRVKYGKEVPLLEQRHAAAKQAVLDQARLVLIRQPPSADPATRRDIFVETQRQDPRPANRGPDITPG